MGKLHVGKHRAIEKDKSYGRHAIPPGFTLAEVEIEDERTRKYCDLSFVNAELIPTLGMDPSLPLVSR